MAECQACRHFAMEHGMPKEFLTEAGKPEAELRYQLDPQRRHSSKKARELERSKKYYEQNRERILAQQKECQAQNEYYEKNREKIADRQKKHRAQNRETIAERSKKYYEKNREKINERKRQYRTQNREGIAERNKKTTSVLRYKQKMAFDYITDTFPELGRKINDACIKRFSGPGQNDTETTTGSYQQVSFDLRRFIKKGR